MSNSEKFFLIMGVLLGLFIMGGIILAFNPPPAEASGIFWRESCYGMAEIQWRPAGNYLVVCKYSSEQPNPAPGWIRSCDGEISTRWVSWLGEFKIYCWPVHIDKNNPVR